MAQSLLEKYSKRLNVANKIYARENNGRTMDNHKQLVIASCLENVNKFLTESFSAGDATQRTDMGNFKRFCLNLTNIAMPNLIAHDLVLVAPMSSMVGYVSYIEYSLGNGVTTNNPFALGDVTEERTTYTKSSVVETADFVTVEGKGSYSLAWKAAWTTKEGLTNGKVLAGTTVLTYAEAPASATEYKITEDNGIVTIVLGGEAEADTKYRVCYEYDNITIPFNNGVGTMPTLKAEMKSIALQAKARRLAIYYSSIAAFQAKTDYGFDLGDALAEQAVGELQFEIDCEVIGVLDTLAGDAASALTWSKTLPVGVSKRDHYAGFAEIAALANQIIYDRTKKFSANYIVASSDILPVLTMCDGFTASARGNAVGPYLAGTFDGLKVFVTPQLTNGRFIVGVNGNDYMSSAAVYAPYMAIVPTQLLEFNDGTNTKGFSTLYDLKPLNAALVVAGQITDLAAAAPPVVTGFDSNLDPSFTEGDRWVAKSTDVGNVVI